MAVTPAVQAADNPYQRGPNPTLSSVRAGSGPYATTSTTVARSAVSGFGGGTVYYPTSTSDGTFGAVAMCPGYTATKESLAWFGPRVASHGFVVFIIDTVTTSDQPAQRGDELLAALDHLTRTSSVRSRIDASRLAVAGHSMGGGGTLEAAKDRPGLRAAVPLAPWNTTKNWSGNRVPTLIIGGQSDTIAAVSSHAVPFYTSLPTTPDKAYLELAGASHFFPQSANADVAMMFVSWLKRFVDGDTRYEQFLCPGPSVSGSVSRYSSTCPLASGPTPTSTTTATTGTSTTRTTTTSSGGSGGGACSASYATSNAWQGGFVGTVTVRADLALSGWQVTLALPAGTTITGSWNGVRSGSTGTVQVRNETYNGILASGQTTSFGFQGSGSPSGLTVTSCTAN
ncbi:MAG: hypothetical protein GXX79_13390 [Actinomycetales bacterium]|nr:hypothetical protein [Actinomycetales bacterium]